jgi:ABC-type nitrate/sulfonate/bicarbonate transport system substrate-binding protein
VTRPPLRPLAALLALALVAAACGDDDGGATDPGELERLTVMLNWVPNAHHVGIYLADAEGWYAEEGLAIEIVEPAFDIGVEAAVAAGQADIGLAQAESLLPARAAGVDVVAVATILPSNDSVLMGLSEDGITEPADLQGATYGGFGGALETELISQLVTCDGGDPAAVEFVEVGNVDYVPGMQQDRFDVAWVFSGWDRLRADEVLGVEATEIRFDDHLDCIPDWYTPLALASGERVADDPDAVRRFLAATARGYEAVVEDPAAGAAAMTDDVLELDAELIDAAVAYYAPRFVAEGAAGWGVMEGEVWERFADFLVTSGLLAEEIDVDAAWTGDLLP